MILDIDIYRSAKLLTVIKAIEELQDVSPPDESTRFH
jgi:hypothetical protein